MSDESKIAGENKSKTKGNSSSVKDVVVGGAVGGTATGVGIAAANVAGISAITHSSGAAIITIGGKMAAGTIGTVAAGVLAAPVVAVAGATAVGGLGYLVYKKLRGVTKGK
jgi:hypothetical protein